MRKQVEIATARQGPGIRARAVLDERLAHVPSAPYDVDCRPNRPWIRGGARGTVVPAQVSTAGQYSPLRFALRICLRWQRASVISQRYSTASLGVAGVVRLRA